MNAPSPAAGIEWRISDALVPYDEAEAIMAARVEAIRAGTAPELVWLLEHPPLYTAGTSARASDLIAPDLLPVFQTGRGGQYTYHGPGQRVGYAMLDLQRRGGDLRAYVRDLEEWLIRTLQQFNLKGERRAGRVGIWIDEGGGKESKIAAIGVRVRRWVSFHGVSLNVDPDLTHYRGIVPCGVREHGVTSLAALGITAAMPEVDTALKTAFREVFARTAHPQPAPTGSGPRGLALPRRPD
ncbi:MAG TPA: lipoyl(octanoyl) transferase LipB [Stellaceae bacterium]|nr:lipoyl(octanoyl) transferase LipB [Stellaceae bacterium]